MADGRRDPAAGGETWGRERGAAAVPLVDPARRELGRLARRHPEHGRAWFTSPRSRASPIRRWSAFAPGPRREDCRSGRNAIRRWPTSPVSPLPRARNTWAASCSATTSWTCSTTRPISPPTCPLYLRAGMTPGQRVLSRGGWVIDLSGSPRAYLGRALEASVMLEAAAAPAGRGRAPAAAGFGSPPKRMPICRRKANGRLAAREDEHVVVGQLDRPLALAQAHAVRKRSRSPRIRTAPGRAPCSSARAMRSSFFFLMRTSFSRR